jgi:NADH-quinone oxidoreductase subunit J
VSPVVFYIFAAVAVGGALLTITRRNPLTSAFCLVITFAGLACLYAYLAAQLVFILQILVYAGAIMVLVIFVIMLLHLTDKELEENRVDWKLVIPALLGGAVGVYALVRAFAGRDVRFGAIPEGFGNIAEVGELLFTRYLFPFEIVSVLLLAALVGVVILARRKV